MAAATIGGFANYVELLTCLEMARDVNNADNNPRGSQTTDTMRLRAPGVTVGVGHDPHAGPSARPRQSLDAALDLKSTYWLKR
jgi:hypothetical protein